MAKTKTTPGPKPRYGSREEIHIKVPVDDLAYIRKQGNVTEWVIKAIQEKRRGKGKSDLLDRAHDLLEYIHLLYRPLTESELKKIEALYLEIEQARAEE